MAARARIVRICSLILLLYIAVIRSQHQCTDDGECDLTESCINGLCKPDDAGCNPPCQHGEFCSGNRCFPDLTPAPPIPAPTPQPPTAAPQPPTAAPQPPTAAPQPPTAAPPPGWDLHNGYYYKVSAGDNPYTQAVQACASMNSKVVWFNQSSPFTYRDELQYVNQLAIASGVRTYWIGLKLMFGQWMWTNEEVLKFPNWRRSQPDRCCGGDVTCVLVNYHTDAGEWEDAGCERIWRRPQGFVCKKKA